MFFLVFLGWFHRISPMLSGYSFCESLFLQFLWLFFSPSVFSRVYYLVACDGLSQLISALLQIDCLFLLLFLLVILLLLLLSICKSVDKYWICQKEHDDLWFSFSAVHSGFLRGWEATPYSCSMLNLGFSCRVVYFVSRFFKRCNMAVVAHASRHRLCNQVVTFQFFLVQDFIILFLGLRMPSHSGVYFRQLKLQGQNCWPPLPFFSLQFPESVKWNNCKLEELKSLQSQVKKKISVTLFL